MHNNMHQVPVKIPGAFPSTQDLSGLVVMVTGAGRGLGRPIAHAMADCGADIIAAGRNMDDLLAVAAEIKQRGRKAAAVVIDVRDPASIQQAVDAGIAKFGRLNVLINNAGISSRLQPQDVTPDEWHQVMDTNVAGPFFTAHAAARHMTARGSGTIINIASVLGAMSAPGLAAYSISKSAVIHMTRTLAIAWAANGIRVNSVAPGFIDSPLNAYRKGTPLEEEVIQGTPLRRWGRVEDVAMACVFLASPAASFITGQTLFVDGGRSAL